MIRILPIVCVFALVSAGNVGRHRSSEYRTADDFGYGGGFGGDFSGGYDYQPQKTIVAGSSEHGRQTAVGSSHTALAGSQQFAGGEASHVSSSKGSSSESNKSSKRKSGSSFAAGGQSYDQFGFGATQSKQTDAGFGGFGGFGGHSSSDVSKIGAQGASGSGAYITGTSNSEVEESESNKQSNFESNDASHVVGVSGSSAFKGESDQKYAADKEYQADSGFAVSGGHGGHGGHGGSVAVGHDSSKLSSSKVGVSSASLAGVSEFQGGSADRVSSSKGSSTSSNHSKKSKTGSTFSGGNYNQAAGSFGAEHASQSSLGHGAFGGFGGASKESSAAFGQSASGSGAFITGQTQSEVEESESSKHDETESHDASHTSNISGASQFAGQADQAYGEHQEASRDQYGYIRH